MESGAFSTSIEDGWIELKTAADVARFSFIVQDSVSYLDLKLCKPSGISDYFSLFCDSCKSRPSINFVNTEEKCHQFFAPRRRLLYTLHLDLPKERECGLKHDAGKFNSSWDCCKNLLISEISLAWRFCDENLSNFIEEALNVNPKEKILKWILNISFWSVSLLSRIEFRIASQFIDCFYPEVTDASLLSDFIKQFNVIEWMKENEQPEILEFLLYHARRFGNIFLDGELKEDFISICICYKHYLNIGPILNYIGDSKPTWSGFVYCLSKLLSQKPNMAANIRDVIARKLKTRERLCLLIQVILIYTDSQGALEETGSEALRLIWSSIPDPCVTSGELRYIFGASLSVEELSAVFDFYNNAT